MKLCSRGIMRSISSENNHREVQDILCQSGLRDYFVFPGIGRSEKADRIEEIFGPAVYHRLFELIGNALSNAASRSWRIAWDREAA